MAPRAPTAWRRLKYRILQHLPGRRGARYRKKYRAAMGPLSEAAFERALAGASGKIGIDLGANVVQILNAVRRGGGDPGRAAILAEGLAQHIAPFARGGAGFCGLDRRGHDVAPLTGGGAERRRGKNHRFWLSAMGIWGK